MRAYIESKHYEDGIVYREIIKTDEIRRIYVAQPYATTIVIETVDGTKIHERYNDEFDCLLRYARLMEALDVWRDPFDNALKREEKSDGGSVHQAL